MNEKLEKTSTNKVAKKFKIPLKFKVEFAIGGIGFNLCAGFFAAWLTNFYIKVVGINEILWGIAWILYFGWNAINDPLIGYLGDKTRTKFGRRRPWLMIAAPMISIAFVLLFFPPILDPTQSFSQIIYFIWLFLMLLFFDTFYTIIGITQKALVAELSILPKERTSATLFWSVGTLFGQVVTFVIPFLFIVNSDPYSQNLPIFQILVFIFAIIGFVMLSLMAVGLKEKKEFMFSEKESMGFKESILFTFKNKSFLIFTLFSFTLVYINFSIYSQMSFFVQDVLQISGSNIISFLPILIFIGASLIGYPIAMFLNKKYGGKRAILYLSTPVIISLVSLTFSNDFMLSNLIILLLGLSYSGMMLLSPILMADVIDKDELETGYRREGSYYGAVNLFTKPAQSVAAFVIGLVFQWTHYDPNNVSALAQFGIKLNIGLIPAIFILIGILILTRFPIDGSTMEYREWKKQVEELHDKKLEEYIKEAEQM
jgi:glycoside/pentoside/hexuronide:cation symporter, GPH family